MADTRGSSDPSTKLSFPRVDDEWSIGLVDENGWPVDGKQETTNTADEAAAAEATDAKATDAEAPSAEAPPRIKFQRQLAVVVLTNSIGEPAAIGSLKASESPACIIKFDRVHENRETSLCLEARFPKFTLGDYPTSQEFQRIGLQFYGDAFENFESDFVISEVKDLNDIPSVLGEHPSVAATVGLHLHNIHLRYQPNKVVTKGKNDPESFALPESSGAADLFRSLVEGEVPRTLDVYARLRPKNVEGLRDIKNRLEQEKDVKPFKEYRDKNDKVVIQWGSKFDPSFDVRSNLSSQLNFRTPEQHAVTLAYGEIREHAYTAEMAMEMLSKEVTISFVAAPGYTNTENVTSRYLGFADLSDHESIGQLFQIGTNATLCFEQPKQFVEPQGWHCVVKPDIPNAEYPGNLVLLIERGDSETIIDTAKKPSPDMLEESKYSVWIYPELSNEPAMRLVDCANKILNGEKDETPEHVAKREDLQKFCSGLEFSSLPKPPRTLFDRSRLTAGQRLELKHIEERCSDDQLAALREIYSCNSFVNMIQGPPGTGKTSFATSILIPMLAVFGIKANCYASSNAATDVFAGKIPKQFKALRFHGVGKEWHGVRSRHDTDEPTPETPAEDAVNEDETVWLQMYKEASSSRPWNVPARKERPHIDTLSLYVRALQRAKVMDDNCELSATLPADVPEEYLEWAEYYYEPPQRGPQQEIDSDQIDQADDAFTNFKKQTMELFEDTLKDANFVITTCSNASDHTLRKSTQPIVVIVDEAGVAKELEALMTMYHNLDSVLMVIFLGDHLQLHPTVLSHLRKLDPDDPNSPPYNIFAPQMCMSLMARQISNGIGHYMFKKQYRMTEGIEELSSLMCYGGHLENADITLLANTHRQPSLAAIDFVRNRFALTTTVPHMFLNVYNGVCLKGRTLSRYNPPNIIIVMHVVESVLEAGLFHGSDICIITPYREQATMIRQALIKAGAANGALVGQGILDVHVNTIDSMQGGESKMTIVDFVLAKRRKGRYGFLTNRGRINVAVTRAQFFQVLVGDINCIQPRKVKEHADEEPEVKEVPDTVVSDEEDQAFAEDQQPWESTTKPIKLLFDFYKEKDVVVNIDHADKPQSRYVNLQDADEFLKQLKCKKCHSEDHRAKDCDNPDALVTCKRCDQQGHKVANCPEPARPKFKCNRCQQEGHKAANCPTKFCIKCRTKGHDINSCTGPERRTCERCREEGHIVKNCRYPKLKNQLGFRKIENLEKGKPIYEPQGAESSVSAQNPAQDSDAVAGGDDKFDDIYDIEEGFAGAAGGGTETDAAGRDTETGAAGGDTETDAAGGDTETGVAGGEDESGVASSEDEETDDAGRDIDHTFDAEESAAGPGAGEATSSDWDDTAVGPGKW